MRLATYNVENLFDRPKAMSLDTWAEGRPILEDLNRLNALIEEPVYTQDIKDELLDIMGRHEGLLDRYRKSEFIRLRDIRRKLFVKPADKPAVE